MSNAQRRREHRQRNRTHPGLMTEARVAELKVVNARLADLERLKRMTREYLKAAQDAEAEEAKDDAGEQGNQDPASPDPGR